MTIKHHAKRIDVSDSWSCPNITGISSATLSRTRSVIESISDVAKLFRSPADSAGLELRVSIYLLQLESALSDSNFWKEKCRTLFLRPSVEPIIWSYWPKLANLNLDSKSAINLSSSLAAKRLEYRQGDGYGISVKGNVKFENHQIARTWLSRLRTTANDYPEEYLLIVSYALCLLAHPFSDGNGRFSRAVFHGILGRLAKIEFPVIALAPVFYLRSEVMRSALSDLNSTGDWDQFGASFLSVVEESVEITTAYLHSGTAQQCRK